MYMYIQYITCITRIKFGGTARSSPLLGDLRPHIPPGVPSAEPLQGTRACLRKVPMVGYFAAGLPGKLVLLCMSDGKLRKSEKVTTGTYKTSQAFSQNLPEIRVEQNGKARKNCAELLSYCTR